MHSTTAALMWLASVEVSSEPLHAKKAPRGFTFSRWRPPPYTERSNCCITFHTHEFLSFSPVRGSTINRHRSEVRFLMFAYSPAKSIAQQNGSFTIYVLRYPRKVPGDHCFSSRCLWISPQITQLNITSLNCDIGLCSVSPAEFPKIFRPIYCCI